MEARQQLPGKQVKDGMGQLSSAKETHALPTSSERSFGHRVMDTMLSKTVNTFTFLWAVSASGFFLQLDTCTK
jgi:hypothetical protein